VLLQCAVKLCANFVEFGVAIIKFGKIVYECGVIAREVCVTIAKLVLVLVLVEFGVTPVEFGKNAVVQSGVSADEFGLVAMLLGVKSVEFN